LSASLQIGTGGLREADDLLIPSKGSPGGAIEPPGERALVEPPLLQTLLELANLDLGRANGGTGEARTARRRRLRKRDEDS
jgi:hypothetical protein